MSRRARRTDVRRPEPAAALHAADVSLEPAAPTRRQRCLLAAAIALQLAWIAALAAMALWK